MRSLNNLEFNNFLRVLGWRIDKGLRYGASLVPLVLRRVTRTIRQLWTKDVHLGQKQWPVWLGHPDLGLGDKRDMPLSFPKYPLASPITESGAEKLPEGSVLDDDPEKYFAGNRWGECILALGDDQRASDAIDHVSRWVKKALPKSDAAWEPYSTCERIVNLALLLSVNPKCRACIDEKTLRSVFEESLQWISDHLEYYGTRHTNNHILNNARGMVVGGTVLQCEPIVERGLVLFARVARDLFQGGGFLRERSSHYQVIVTGWLLDTLHFARSASIRSAAGITALAELEDLAGRVTRATTILLAYLDKLDTHIGDISPDISPAVSTRRLDRLYPGAIETLTTLPTKHIDDWIFFAKGGHALTTCTVPSPYPLKFTTHGHSDLGGFVWAYQGMPLLVDAGRSRYTFAPSLSFQIGPRGHNTLVVNGLGALAGSLFEKTYWYPEPYSTAVISDEVNSERGLTIRHNGFCRIRNVGKHIRQIQVEGERLSVLDEVDGAGIVSLETFWHFPPSLAPLVGERCAISGGGIRVTINSSAQDRKSVV